MAFPNLFSKLKKVSIDKATDAAKEIVNNIKKDAIDDETLKTFGYTAAGIFIDISMMIGIKNDIAREIARANEIQTPVEIPQALPEPDQFLYIPNPTGSGRALRVTLNAGLTPSEIAAIADKLL